MATVNALQAGHRTALKQLQRQLAAEHGNARRALRDELASAVAS